MDDRFYKLVLGTYPIKRDGSPWKYNLKEEGPPFAARFGVPVPRQYHWAKTKAEMLEVSLPSRAVVKPSSLCSSRGISALVKCGEDQWLRVFEKRGVLSLNEVRQEQVDLWGERQEAIGIPGRKHAVIVQEFIQSPMGELCLPLDVKVYCIWGEPVFIAVTNRNFGVPRYSYFTPAWRDAQDHLLSRETPLGWSVPVWKDEVLGYARLLAKKLDTPFVSLDFFDGVDGPVFGEVSPIPGHIYYNAVGTEKTMWEFTQGVRATWADLWEAGAARRREHDLRMAYLAGHKGDGYWLPRAEWQYYKLVRKWLNETAPGGSLCDVGGHDTPVSAWGDFDHRTNHSKGSVSQRLPQVRYVTGDFMDSDECYDVVTCLQVMEHLEDGVVQTLAKKLLAAARKTLIVSVPYKWPAGQEAGHPQDPVDWDKLRGWMGRPPDEYHIVVEDDGCRRLVARFELGGGAGACV